MVYCVQTKRAQQITREGGRRPRWSRDDKTVYFVNQFPLGNYATYALDVADVRRKLALPAAGPPAGEQK